MDSSPSKKACKGFPARLKAGRQVGFIPIAIGAHFIFRTPSEGIAKNIKIHSIFLLSAGSGRKHRGLK